MKFLVDVGVGKKVETWLKGSGFEITKKILTEYHDRINPISAYFKAGDSGLEGKSGKGPLFTRTYYTVSHVKV
jgi:hypothetical protein